jgi:ATP-dependent DNA helicase RecG
MVSALPINVLDLLQGRVESLRLEFKADWNKGPTANQVLQTICAFANDLQNVNGGYVVLGVEEDEREKGRTRLPPRGLGEVDLDQLQRNIRGLCERLEPTYQPILSPELVEGRPLLVVWAHASDRRPHQAPEALTKGSGKKYFVRLGSETVEAKGEILRQLLEVATRTPFDDRRCSAARIEDLREGRVREFLVDIQSGLVQERDAPTVYRKLRLVDRVNGHEAPKNVALLFFSDDPEQWFPGARIEVAHYAGDAGGDVIEERVFRGPLAQQLRDALGYLRNISTRHLEKLRNRPEVKGWVSYPYAAMEEALVNAVYHRSYEGNPEPTKVYLYPDRLEIISYPGPVPGIELGHLQPGARVPPVPARNRRIGELLKDLRLAEQRGTGVPKVFRAMEQNGSPVPQFDFDVARTYFRVTLPAHPEYVAIAALRDAAHLRAVGDTAGALARLRRALEEQPASGTLATELVEELVQADDLVAARQILDRLPGALEPAVAIRAALLERRLGREDRAHQLFQRAGDEVYRDVRALHEFAQTKSHLAGEIYRRGRRASQFDQEARLRLLREARDMFERVLQMDAPPLRHAWAWFELGRIRRWLGDPPSEVHKAFAEARRLAPDDPKLRKALDRAEKPRPAGSRTAS